MIYFYFMSCFYIYLYKYKATGKLPTQAKMHLDLFCVLERLLSYKSTAHGEAGPAREEGTQNSNPFSAKSEGKAVR